MKKALAIFAAYYRRLEEAVGRFMPPVKEEPPILNGEHSTFNIQRRTFNEGNGGASLPAREQRADDNSVPLSALRVPSSALSPNFITRDELKRELDSLRRLIESRK
jgi:hypothetical protein